MSALAETAYDARQFEDNFPAGIEDHYWFKARNRMLDEMLRRAERAGWLPAAPAIVEVGCGTGVVVAALRAAGHRVSGVEIGSPTPLPAAVPFVVTATAAQNLDPDIRAGADALLFLDVIEHVPDDVAFLRETLEAFPNCRAIGVTVPAAPELWSSHDEHYGHFRRYRDDSLRASLTAAGLRPLAVETMFHGLYAAAALMKLTGRDRNPVMQPPANPALHRLLAAGLVLDSRLGRALPLPGLSLIAMAAVERPNCA